MGGDQQDPGAIAAQQTASNQATAKAQAELNMVNQNTPYGSLAYNQTGTAADGTPQYTATTTLSPELQNLVGSNIQGAQGMSDAQNALMGNVQNNVTHPLDLSWGATEANLDQLGRQTLDPQFAQQNNQLEAKLYNQGLRPGTEAYDYAMNQNAQQQGQQYNNLYLQGHNTAVNDLTTQYNSPFNALASLRSGTQVAQPGIGQVQTPQTGVQGTNVAGIYQAANQANMAQNNATMGGLFGLGGSLLAAPMTGGGSVGGALMSGLFASDRRVKKDIRRIGVIANGLPVYSFRYIWGGGEQIGLMAQDVELVHPEAVHEIGGIKVVNYDLAVL